MPKYYVYIPLRTFLHVNNMKTFAEFQKIQDNFVEMFNPRRT